MNKFLVWAVVPISVVSMSAAARAAEVTLIGPGGIRAAVDQMIPAFEKATGHKVKATLGSGGGTKERVIKGEPFDVPIVQLPLEPVVASGHVMAASETPLAFVAVGVAVRTGAPKPDISSADAVKRLLLGAKAIAYPNAATGAAAGVSFNETLQKLGIADAMKPKIKIAQGGRGAMELLAKGEVDIGLTPMSFEGFRAPHLLPAALFHSAHSLIAALPACERLLRPLTILQHQINQRPACSIPTMARLIASLRRLVSPARTALTSSGPIAEIRPRENTGAHHCRSHPQPGRDRRHSFTYFPVRRPEPAAPAAAAFP